MKERISIREATELLDCTRQWLYKLRREENEMMGEAMHRGKPAFHRATFLEWMRDYNNNRRKPCRRQVHE